MTLLESASAALVEAAMAGDDALARRLYADCQADPGLRSVRRSLREWLADAQEALAAVGDREVEPARWRL